LSKPRRPPRMAAPVYERRHTREGERGDEANAGISDRVRFRSHRNPLRAWHHVRGPGEKLRHRALPRRAGAQYRSAPHRRASDAGAGGVALTMETRPPVVITFGG